MLKEGGLRDSEGSVGLGSSTLVWSTLLRILLNVLPPNEVPPEPDGSCVLSNTVDEAVLKVG